MKQFFQNIGYKLQRAMQGRYGTDELNRALSIGSIGLFILSLILARVTQTEDGSASVAASILYYIALAGIIFYCIRTYSKKLEKRRAERTAYLNLVNRVKNFFNLQKRKWTERKTHVYFKCPKCKKQLRVPKGKGNLRITCPGCGEVIEKRT